jgi:hypothetical protein
MIDRAGDAVGTSRGSSLKLLAYSSCPDLLTPPEPFKATLNVVVAEELALHGPEDVAHGTTV